MTRGDVAGSILNFAFALAVLIAPSAPGAEEPFEPGLAVGTKAPDFRLPDQDGNERALSELVAPQRNLALVFVRSADW